MIVSDTIWRAWLAALWSVGVAAGSSAAGSGQSAAEPPQASNPTAAVMAFRGPDGVGLFPQAKDLPRQWSVSTGDNIAWRTPLPGRGLSQPVVSGGLAFVTACSGREGEVLHVLAIDLASGRIAWQRRFAATGLTGCHPKTNMAAPTPVTDGQRVYALFATCDLICTDTAGNLLWYRALAVDHPKLSNQVGMASSPALVGGTLAVSMETGAESWLAGIDPLTGLTRWRAPRHREINWTTPVGLTRDDGRVELLMQSRSDLTAYDPATGQVLWQYTAEKLNAITSPVVGRGGATAAELLTLVPGNALTALRVPTSLAGEPSVLWNQPKLRPGTATPLVAGQRVYTLNNAGILSCGDLASGEVLWQQRLKGPFSASPMVADGCLYAVNEEGTVFVVAPADGKVIATNAMGETILACPVAVPGAILLRSDQHLTCVGRPPGGVAKPAQPQVEQPPDR